MISKDEALKMAIEALENIAFEYGNLLDGEQDYGLLPSETNKDIIIAYKVKRLCQEALEQPTQEPVGYVNEDQYGYGASLKVGLKHGTKLYTQPKEWKELSDDEITNSESDYTDRKNGLLDVYGFVKDIELILKGKNYG